MEKYFFGIDVGGTSVKGGIVSETGKILYKQAVAINRFSAISCLESVAFSLKEYADTHNIQADGIGVGVPCIFDKESGVVSYGNNLDFQGVNLKKYFSDKFGLKAELVNDADAAVLGEYIFGAGKGYKDIALITIGTGIGGGFILNGALLENRSSCFGEIGHTVIKANGKKCACGRKGCMEAYCSMPALYRQIKKAMLKNRQSALWKFVDVYNIDGKAFFNCLGKDDTADKVMRRYLEYLGIGIVNVANVFHPEIILIGGGVSAQKERLLNPLQEYLDKNLFAREYVGRIEIKAAKNGNDAGILGAAATMIV